MCLSTTSFLLFPFTISFLIISLIAACANYCPEPEDDDPRTGLKLKTLGDIRGVFFTWCIRDSTCCSKLKWDCCNFDVCILSVFYRVIPCWFGLLRCISAMCWGDINSDLVSFRSRLVLPRRSLLLSLSNICTLFLKFFNCTRVRGLFKEFFPAVIF